MYWIYFSRFLHISGLLCRRKCWKEHHTSLLAGIGRMQMHFSTFLASCPPIGVLPAKRVDSKHKSWWSFISFPSQTLGPKYTYGRIFAPTKRIPTCIGKSILIPRHKPLISMGLRCSITGRLLVKVLRVNIRIASPELSHFLAIPVMFSCPWILRSTCPKQFPVLDYFTGDLEIWTNWASFGCTLSILNPQNWLFWGPNPCVIQVQPLPLEGPMILRATRKRDQKQVLGGAVVTAYAIIAGVDAGCGPGLTSHG